MWSVERRICNVEPDLECLGLCGELSVPDGL